MSISELSKVDIKSNKLLSKKFLNLKIESVSMDLGLELLGAGQRDWVRVFQERIDQIRK